MSERKTFVIDTNVLLNDPMCLDGFGENNVVIPLVVLEELDNFKKGHTFHASAARTVSRFLDGLRKNGESYSKGVDLPGGGQLYIPNLDLEVSNVSFKDNNDNLIVETCLFLHNSGRKGADSVVLVTEDINLRVRAAAVGVDSQEHKAAQVKDISFYSQVRVVECGGYDIDDLYQFNRIKLDGLGDDVLPNEYMVLKAGSQSCFVVYDESLNDGYNLSRVLDCKAYGVKPRNKEQRFALDALTNPDIKLVVLAGKAGSGKTICALAAGLQQVLEENRYERMTVARPIVPMGNDLGFLPGSLAEKLDPWMLPIYDNMDALHRKAAKGPGGYKRGGRELMSELEDMGKVEVSALSYIRGRSISNQFIIIDEAQNLSAHEIKTIVTRVGEGSKIVVTGDPYQIDSPYLSADNNALSHLIDRLKGQELFAHVTMLEGERSELAEVASNLL